MPASDAGHRAACHWRGFELMQSFLFIFFLFSHLCKFSSQLRIQSEKEMENGCVCACTVLTGRPIFLCNFKGQLPLEERRKRD